MNIKEITSKAGSISNYLIFIILLFGWNALNDLYKLVIPDSSRGVSLLVSYGLSLLVGPLFLTIVYGGIYNRQTVQDDLERKSILSNIKAHGLRFIGSNILFLLIYVVLGAILFPTQSGAETGQGSLPLAILSASFSTLMLFWYSALVVEPKLFRSLIHAVKTLLSNPAALLIGVVWFAIVSADNLAFDLKGEQVPLAINLARSAVLAVLKVIAVMYILVIYKNKWGGLIQRVQADEILKGASKSRPGERLAKVSLWFTFFSFIPLLHLVALILGGISLKRRRGFILKAAVACWVGGFFTILYTLLVAGYFAGQTNTVRMPDYSFLADANAETQPYVDLLGQGAGEDILVQLGDSAENTSERDWTIDTALALAEYQGNNLDGALKDFSIALQKNPERSEFYFYYGLALLDNEETGMAKEQFQLALDHEPKLMIADQYLNLVQNQFKPDIIGNALIYLVILFILFPLHEYGHAFAAWKLGDDTAREQGRLTLNPVSHLDLFGSIILPAVLLFQQSDILFGWARPVPVNTSNFKNPDKDHMMVSFAGPAVNLMVAMVCMIVLVLIVLIIRLLWPETRSLNLVDPFSATSLAGVPFSKGILILIIFLKQMFYTSLILGVFNLLPIPPLDGSWILSGLLPQGLRGIFDTVRPFSFVLLILLSMTPVLDYILSVPLGVVWIGMRWVVSALGFA